MLHFGMRRCEPTEEELRKIAFYLGRKGLKGERARRATPFVEHQCRTLWQAELEYLARSTRGRQA
eukprot:6634851-Lingulodinium_polyedra.AAC.1